jgi:hypothetical protein
VIQLHQRRTLIVVQLEEAFLAEALDAIGAAENLPVGREPLVLVGLQGSRPKLVQLKLHELQPCGALSIVHPEAIDLLADVLHSVKCPSYGLSSWPELTEFVEDQ